MSAPTSTPSTASAVASAPAAASGLFTRTQLTALAVALLAITWGFLPEFTVVVMSYIGLYSIVAVGLVMLTGVGGMTSFGQAAFVGIGATPPLGPAPRQRRCKRSVAGWAWAACPGWAWCWAWC